jgi:hypothetical protein
MDAIDLLEQDRVAEFEELMRVNTKNWKKAYRIYLELKETTFLHPKWDTVFAALILVSMTKTYKTICFKYNDKVVHEFRFI